MGLNELMAFIRIKSAGNVLGNTIEHILPQGRWVGRCGDCMQVNYSKITIILVEHFGPITNRSQIVTQGKFTRWLGTG
jgi:hypothetical protein